MQGIAWMIVTTLMFVAVTGIVRHLGSDMPPGEAAFIRYLIGCGLMLPVFLRMRRTPIPSGLWRLGAIRGAAHAGAVTLWFFAMARIPVAEVTAIGYVTPIVITIGAALFLGERLRLHRIMGVVAGLIGALVILRPGFQEISIGQIAQVCTAPLFAVSYLMTKSMTGKADSQVIVALLTIFCTLFLLPIALIDWQTPSWREIGWLAATAVGATAGHYAMTRALAAAPISVTQPITFLQLVWAAMLGVFVFDEPLDPYVIAGGLIIVGAATYIAHRESLLARATAEVLAPDG